MAEKTKIEPLERNNYQSWKYNMKLVLMERGLWGFAQGTETLPGQTEAPAVRYAYKLKSDKAYSLIALSVSKSLQAHIMSTTDPAEAWNTLQKQFEFISITQIVRLNRKFYAASVKEGDNLMEHITYMTSLAEQLRELKEDISTKKFATVILGSLPDSYENFISSLNARNIDELEWDSIKGSLIEEYMNRKEKDEKQIPTSKNALFTSGHRRQFKHRAHSARGTGRPTSNRPNFRTSQSRNQNGSEESWSHRKELST